MSRLCQPLGIEQELARIAAEEERRRQEARVRQDVEVEYRRQTEETINIERAQIKVLEVQQREAVERERRKVRQKSVVTLCYHF